MIVSFFFYELCVPLKVFEIVRVVLDRDILGVCREQFDRRKIINVRNRHNLHVAFSDRNPIRLAEIKLPESLVSRRELLTKDTL